MTARHARARARSRIRRARLEHRIGRETLERRELLAADFSADVSGTYLPNVNFGDSALADFWNASAAERAAIRNARNAAVETAVQDRGAEQPDEMIVRLPAGVTAAEFASARGLDVSYTFRSDDRIVVLKAASTAEASRAAELLSTAQGVEFLGFNVPTSNEPFGAPFTPNDPYFPRNQPASGWPGQWHLSNQQNPGRDARVTGAWTAGFTGQGVTIGIVDDGLQIDHPDLSPNYSASSSYDFGSNDAIPNPVNSYDNHGTSVAGVAAARGGNGIGVTGAAPYATLAGLRVPFDNTQTSAMFADATLYKSSGADTTIKIKNHSYGYRAPYVITTGTTQEVQAVATSTTAGTIHVFAAGNDRGTQGADSNKKHSQADPNVITVAAFGSDGTWGDYSSYGANVFVTATSSSSKGINNATGVTTTDRTGTNGYNPNALDSFPDQSYTSVFGGTSSAAPLVSGVLALVKEAQPALTTRFAKHLLARTSDVVDAGDSTVTGGGNGTTYGSAWKTNAAGRKFNMNYGFGLVDAAELVSEATKYSGVTTLQTYGSGSLTVNLPIFDAAGVTRTTSVSVANAKPLEEVVIALDVTHTYRGDLEAYLTSPSGTTSRLMISNLEDYTDNVTWSFTSNAFWGESPNGTWSLRLVDTYADADTGTWKSWGLNLRMGELVPVVSTGSISGAVWTDTDGDGWWDGGESGASGWTVYLDRDNSGSLTAGDTSTVTSGNGSYSFTGLSAGTYPVSTVVQTGWWRTSGAPAYVTLSPGQQYQNLNFGHQRLNQGITVSISDAQVTEGNSGTRTMSFNVTLSGSISMPVSVSYATANGTATTADNDYVAASGTITFTTSGSLTRTIDVTINGDTTYESNESFTVTLSNPSGATIGRAAATGSILNDDTNAFIPPESNDTRRTAYYLGGSYASTTTVTVGGTIGDGSWGSRDVDLVKIYLGRQERVNVQVRARRLPLGSDLDSYLRLFNSSGKQVAVNDDYSGLDSGISFVAKKAGWFVIGVSGYGNYSYKTDRAGSGRSGSTGEYELDVEYLAVSPLAATVSPLAATVSPLAATASASKATIDRGLVAAYALEGQSTKPARRALLGR